MSSLSGYNIIKEGDLYNTEGLESTLFRYYLNAGQLQGLCNDSFTAVTTVTGTSISGSYFSVDVAFGETYEVHTVRYYQNLTTLSGITITYGVDSPTESVAALTLASGTVETSPLGDLRYARVTHSCSPGVEIEPAQIVVLGVENDLIGFGNSPETTVKARFMPSSPVGVLSSRALEVPVYNRHYGPIDINLAVKPTGAYRDKYLRLGLTSSGTFYGINDYGPGTYQTELLQLSSYSFTGDSIAELSSQWEVIQGNAQAQVSLSTSGLFVGTSSAYSFAEAQVGATNFYGVVSRDTFSCDQSFMLKVKIKVSKLSNAFYGAMDVVLGFSSGMPTPCESYNTYYPYVDEHSCARPVRAGVCLGWSTDNYSAGHSWGDEGGDSIYRLSVADGDLGQTESMTWSWDEVGAVSNAQFSLALYGDTNENLDGTSSAVFRELILTWDHVDRLVEGFIDKVKVGSYRMIFPPIAGCKVFIGLNSARFPITSLEIKDFVVDTQNLYRQSNLFLGRGISSVSSTTSFDLIDHNASNSAQSPIPSYDYLLGTVIPATADNCWCTEAPPAIYESLSLVFDVSDVVALELYAPTSLAGTTFGGVAGVVSFSRIPKIAWISVGDISAFFTLQSTLGYRNIFAATASGVSSATISFADYHLLNGGALKDAALLSNVVVVTENIVPITTHPSTTASGVVPWTRGVFKNMKPFGGSKSWTIADSSITELTRVHDVGGLYKGVDYDYSTAFSRYDAGYSLPTSPNPQSIFRSRDAAEYSNSNVTGAWQWVGHPVWVWRRFPCNARLCAVGFSWGSSLGIPVEQGYPNKFKLQYLVLSGNPSVETDWVDVPPVSVAWPYGGDYATYKQWFIDNNDGEYYTDVAFAFPGDPGMPAAMFVIPSEATAMKDYRWGVSGEWYITQAGAIVNEVYLELDAAIETGAIRLVIAECLDTTRLISASSMNLLRFSAFSDTSYGTYLSPGFDTETDNNTERLATSLQFGPTSSGTIYVRSSSTAPSYASDHKVLTWQPWHIPLYGTVYDVYSSTAQEYASLANIQAYGTWPNFGVVVGSRVYLGAPDSSNYPVYYDYSTGNWGTFAKMGESSENVRPDSRVTNNAVILSNGSMYVAVRYGDVNDARIMRYDFQPDEYNISGWRHLGVNRPEEAQNAAMVGYGQSLFFFCTDGTTVEYDVDSGTWDPTLASVPLHGLAERWYAWPAVIGTKAYLAGGSWGIDLCGYIDEFDFITKTWRTVAQLPIAIRTSVQTVVYGSKVYVLPRGYSYHTVPGYAIFDTETNQVESADFYRLSSCTFVDQQNFFEACGASWVYEGTLYSFQAGDPGIGIELKKCKLDRTPWSPGFLPAKYDSDWGSSTSSALAWFPVASFGELLPQERYFQFKVEIAESNPSPYNCATLQKITVVQPQKIRRVPVSGTSSFYLKMGVSDEDSYLGWYSSNRVDGTETPAFQGYFSNVLNTHFDGSFSPTDAGLAFEYPPYEGYVNPWRLSYFDPCVILDGAEYKMWFSEARSTTTNLAFGTTESGSLNYSYSADGIVWAAPQTVLSYENTTLSGICSHAVFSPCVLKEGSSDFKMWYSCSDGSGVHRVLLNTSADGISWGVGALSHDINTSALPDQADSTGAQEPWVLGLEDGTYRMWYTGLGPSGDPSIITCTSASGTDWNTHNVVVSPGFHGYYDEAGASKPSVVLDVGEFAMWYVGRAIDGVTRILHTTSADGITWATPSLAVAPGLSGQDVAGLGRFSVLVNRVPEEYNHYLTGISVKIHD